MTETVGSDITPASLAAMSPILLLIANPGMSTWFYHTLNGPTCLLLWFLSYNTLPPLLIILFFSSGSSGLWSLDIS